MLCSVAQLPGQLNKGSRMAKFQTIIYLFIWAPCRKPSQFAFGGAIIKSLLLVGRAASKGPTPLEMRIIF